jgi:hypothetical protein
VYFYFVENGSANESGDVDDVGVNADADVGVYFENHVDVDVVVVADSDYLVVFV